MVPPADYVGEKGRSLKGGHRVPGIFNWPGRLPKGEVCQTPILTMDLLPTFVSMGGGEIEPKRKLDGIDVTKALKGADHHPEAAFLEARWQLGG